MILINIKHEDFNAFVKQLTSMYDFNEYEIESIFNWFNTWGRHFANEGTNFELCVHTDDLGKIMLNSAVDNNL